MNPGLEKTEALKRQARFSMAVRLNGPDAAAKKMSINVIFTDRDESYVLTLENAPFCSISASDSNFNPRNIEYIPMV
jgi:alkyl sulfatase BDS1-like metallo-beta-lactamase superfamily hydrolase